MPTIMLRALPAELVGRVRAYATAHGLGLAAGAVRLIRLALDRWERERQDGHTDG